MIFFSTLRTLELSLVDLWDLLWSLYCLWVLETKSVPRIVKFKPKCCLVILKSKLLQWTLQLTKVSKFMWISWMKIIQNTLQNCEASQQFSHCTFFILFCRIKIIMLNYFFCARKLKWTLDFFFYFRKLDMNKSYSSSPEWFVNYFPLHNQVIIFRVTKNRVIRKTQNI